MSKKVVGSDISDGIIFDKPILKSINELMEYSDLIVVGEPLPDPATISWENPSVKGKSIDAKIYLTQYSFKIEKAILGDEKGVVKFTQMGKVGNDGSETKIKPGNKYLIFMSKNEENERYHSVCLEEGIFQIDKSNRLLSFSKNLIFAKYDTIDINVLIEDIVNSSIDFGTKR